MTILEKPKLPSIEKKLFKRGTPLADIDVKDVALIPTGRSTEAIASSLDCPQASSPEPNCGGCAWSLLTETPIKISDPSSYFVAAQYSASCGSNLIVKNVHGEIGVVRKNEQEELFFFPGISGNFAFERFVKEAII